MPTLAPHAYADWKAPAADGALLLWPDRGTLLSQTSENQRRLSATADVLVQNVPLADLRRATRQFIGHDDAKPLVMTGHQTELHHPGVWVKNAVIDAIATVLGGAAYHLAVDTDQPKHLTFRWPGVAIPVTDDERLANVAWSAQLNVPTGSHLQSIADALPSLESLAPGTMLRDWLGHARSTLLDSPDLSHLLTNASHAVDWQLGLRQHALLASPLWAGETFCAFVHHCLANIERLAADYNAALTDYRAETGGKDPNRPMPNLFVSAEAIETPFWLDDLRQGVRTRPSVFRTDAGWALELVEGGEFVFDPKADAFEAGRALLMFLRRHGFRVAPRALTLTTFARLFVADQFVHGIGGGRYDQVTDRLIAKFFGVEPPHFSVATGTLLFPSAVGRQRVCVPCVKQEGHRLKHNLLGDRKRELVGAIAAAPRRSAERSSLFQQLHRERRSMELESPLIIEWRHRLEDTRRQEALERDEFSRELPYVVQTRERLDQMIAHVRAAVGVAT